MKYKIISYLLISAFSSLPNIQYAQPEKQVIEVVYEDVAKEEFVDEIVIYYEECNEDVWATSDVNIRKGPGTEFEVVGGLKKGNKIKRIGVGENGWSKVIYNNNEYFISSKYLSKTEIKKEEPKKEINIDGCYVQKDGNVDNYFVKLANDQYLKIPQNIRNYLESNGFQIYVTDKNIAQTWFAGQYSSVQGVTLLGPKIVYVEDREKACKGATVHECGHALDSYLLMISWSREFEELFEKDAAIFKEPGSNVNYADRGPQEYFAELFNQMVLNPNHVKNTVPDSYNYMINLMNSL